MSETNNFVLCKVWRMLASLPGSGTFLSEGCLEVPAPMRSSQFISHDRVLDSQFLLQMDLSLGSKLLIRGGLVSLPGRRETKGHLRVRCFLCLFPLVLKKGRKSGPFLHMHVCTSQHGTKVWSQSGKWRRASCFQKEIRLRPFHFTWKRKQ